MPISTSSFDDERDSQYTQYENNSLYEQETMEFAGLRLAVAEDLLKKLGGGVSEKLKAVEGIGWKASFEKIEGGVAVTFDAHDELLDDLIRRFEDMAEKAVR